MDLPFSLRLVEVCHSGRELSLCSSRARLASVAFLVEQSTFPGSFVSHTVVLVIFATAE